MEYCSVTATPRSLIDPNIDIMSDEGIAQLNMITIRVELKLRSLEFMGLIDMCGSRNVQLVGIRRTTMEELDNDLGNEVRQKYPKIYNELTGDDKTVFGMMEYHCVAYLRGRCILNLLSSPNISDIFPEKGRIIEEDLVLKNMLPRIYQNIYTSWLMNGKERTPMVQEIPAYDCGVADESAVTRYISNGIHTVNCISIESGDINLLKDTNDIPNKIPQLTLVCRTNLSRFISIFNEHPFCVEILAHDPLYSLFGNALIETDEPNECMLVANMLPESTQITYVVRISFYQDALDSLSVCDWYQEGNPIYDEVHRVLYELNIFA